MIGPSAEVARVVRTVQSCGTVARCFSPLDPVGASISPNAL
jgi:hypothetical protein